MTALYREKRKTSLSLVDDPLHSVEESARRLGGISPWTIYSWVSKGRLRKTKVGGRGMIRESELLRVVKEG